MYKTSNGKITLNIASSSKYIVMKNDIITVRKRKKKELRYWDEHLNHIQNLNLVHEMLISLPHITGDLQSVI
jgi:hypothetical protein